MSFPLDELIAQGSQLPKVVTVQPMPCHAVLCRVLETAL